MNAAVASVLAALEFPPISHVLEWPDMALKGNEWFAFNKIALLTILSTLFTLLLFFAGGRKKQLVPTGVQNVAEAAVDFVREGIVMQTMGHHGLAWLPFLTSIFFFIFFNNLFEVVPGIMMPVNARMAMPLFLALVVYVVYNVVGVKSQGLAYFKNSLIPPGVPVALLPLVVPIEFVSNFLVRPFSLAVRLFANMLAGHLLLVTFGVLAAAMFTKSILVVILPLPFLVLVMLTGFEIFVAGLQAYIFTMLAAVYINGAQHADH